MTDKENDLDTADIAKLNSYEKSLDCEKVRSAVSGEKIGKSHLKRVSFKLNS
jgi:hypothetical protein